MIQCQNDEKHDCLLIETAQIIVELFIGYFIIQTYKTRFI